jgi:enoyl-CoA hydratase/carnithine racemase
MPVVAAIDGRCLAGGLELALACDLIAATKAARFFDAHLAGGLLPAGGAAIRLPERISRSRSFQLLVEGVEVDADQALDWGLVDTVFETRDELSGWLGKLGDRLARYPPGLAPSIKRQLGATRHPRGGAEFELQLQHLQEYAERNRGYLREQLRRYT